MEKFARSAVVAATLAFIVPGASFAAVQSQSFTIQVPSGTPVGAGANVASSTFAQFDPALGALTEVDASFSGSGSWIDPAPAQMLVLALVVHGSQIVLAGQQYFFTPGSVQYSFSGSDVYLPELTSFIGSGQTQVDLFLQGSGGTFSTPLTDGTLSYVYTPAIPEPGTALLAGLALITVAVVQRSSWARR